jgi:hypothetical protein
MIIDHVRIKIDCLSYDDCQTIPIEDLKRRVHKSFEAAATMRQTTKYQLYYREEFTYFNKKTTRTLVLVLTVWVPDVIMSKEDETLPLPRAKQ